MRFISLDKRKENIYWYFFASGRGYFVTNTFLLMPVTINGETRWLEKTKIKWKIMSSNSRELFSNKYTYDWRAIEFIN